MCVIDQIANGLHGTMPLGSGGHGIFKAFVYMRVRKRSISFQILGGGGIRDLYILNLHMQLDFSVFWFI